MTYGRFARRFLCDVDFDFDFVFAFAMPHYSAASEPPMSMTNPSPAELPSLNFVTTQVR
jgi:hypothetical protein